MDLLVGGGRVFRRSWAPIVDARPGVRVEIALPLIGMLLAWLELFLCDTLLGVETSQLLVSCS